VLAVLHEAIGALDKVKRVVKIQGFVNSTPEFTEQHKVLNGFSDLMIDVFGERLDGVFMTEPWTGSAAICINQKNEILMVLQGKPEEVKKWSVPSGGKLPEETYEECCKREVYEETGFVVEVKQRLFVKNGIVHYFLVEVVGGTMNIQDPDGLIYDISWKSLEEIYDLDLCFEEDRDMIIEVLKQNRESVKGSENQ
jgi:ADP-ribose pyrophosphatase YjhB (NUDIX family)